MEILTNEEMLEIEGGDWFGGGGGLLSAICYALAGI